MVTNTPGTALAATHDAKSLSVYSRIADPMAAVKSLGRSIAMSKMLGNITIEAGELLALECLSSGVPPLSLKRRYHVTKFGLMQQSSWTMSEFQRAGGTVKELSRTPELAKAEFTINGESYVASLSWEEAQKEPYPYMGREDEVLAAWAARKKVPLKPKYQTPHSRKQMLWWRLVNDTIRSHWPDINGGIYAAEEVDPDSVDDSTIDASYEVVAEQVSEATEAASESTTEAEATPAESTAKTVAETSAATEPEFCTHQQRELIQHLFTECGMSADQQVEVLAKRKAQSLRNLTNEQAVELIAKLQVKLAQIKAQAEATAKATTTEPITHEGQYVDAICTAEQVDEVKSLLKEIEQGKPGTSARYVAKMKERGIKTADLSFAACRQIIEQLKAKNIEAFFALSLEKWVPKESAEPGSEPAKN